MINSKLNQRCVDLFFHPRVQISAWPVMLFWHLAEHAPRNAALLLQPKVDLLELEVLLAAAAQVPSQCEALLDELLPNRAKFIRYSVQRGRQPLLNLAPLMSVAA